MAPCGKIVAWAVEKSVSAETFATAIGSNSGWSGRHLLKIFRCFSPAIWHNRCALAVSACFAVRGDALEGRVSVWHDRVVNEHPAKHDVAE